ncbi:MAG: hypothetical protein ACUX7D_02535 [Candidatus Methanodesulfokora washburnensis]
MLVTCPNCGFRFDVSYSRMKSCSGCPVLSNNLSCNLIKCPRCGHEFSKY